MLLCSQSLSKTPDLQLHLVPHPPAPPGVGQQRCVDVVYCASQGANERSTLHGQYSVMIGLVNMPSIVEPVMHSPRRKKKTRRGKKPTFSRREMIPPPPPVSLSVESQKVSPMPVGCGCGADMNLGRLPISPRKKNVKSKPYLRPTPPKAPLNSTQFIMEEGYDMGDPEFLSLYHSTDGCRHCVCGSSPMSVGSETGSSRKSSTTSNRESLDFDFLLDGEQGIQSFRSLVLNDFESDMANCQPDLDGRVFFSPPVKKALNMSFFPSPGSCSSDESDLSDAHSSTSSAASLHSSPTSPVNEQEIQFNSWSNTSILFDTDSQSDSYQLENSYRSQSFTTFMKNDFEAEVRRNKEEGLFELNNEDLIQDIITMQNRINNLAKLQSQLEKLNRLKVENQILRCRNAQLSSL